MAVPPEFIEDLRQRVPLSDVVGRRVKADPQRPPS
jgi:DNA primase